MELDLSFNNIIKIPNNINKMSNLTKFNLNHNNIKTHHIMCFLFINIENLMLSYNNIKSCTITSKIAHTQTIMVRP